MVINTVFVFLFGYVWIWSLKKLPSLKLVAQISPSPFRPCYLRFIHNGRKKIQSSNDGNVLSHLAKVYKGFTVWSPKCPLEYPPNKTTVSQDSLARLDSETVWRFLVWRYEGGLVDTCILIGLAKASQDLLTYDWSRRLEALARAAQESYIV